MQNQIGTGGPDILSQSISNPKFSVVIPVYNTEKYLDEAVQSVIAQTETNFEILLVDDGSTDNSGKICDRWAEKDNRIKVFHQKNKGQIAARECGIRNACGEYVVFLDSDDLIDNDLLATIDKEIQYSHADCIIYGYRKMDNGITNYKCVDKEKLIINDVNLLFSKILSNSTYNSMCRKAYRREILIGNDYSKLYDLRHGEDLVQSLIILYKCKQALFLDKILYTYRMLPSSISHNRCNVDFLDCFGAREAVYDLLIHYSKIDNRVVMDYRNQCIKHFVRIIVQILDELISNKEKKNMLRKMKDLPWYTKLSLSNDRMSSITYQEKMIIWLFVHNHVNTLLLLSKCRRILRAH